MTAGRRAAMAAACAAALAAGVAAVAQPLVAAAPAADRAAAALCRDGTRPASRQTRAPASRRTGTSARARRAAARARRGRARVLVRWRETSTRAACFDDAALGGPSGSGASPTSPAGPGGSGGTGGGPGGTGTEISTPPLPTEPNAVGANAYDINGVFVLRLTRTAVRAGELTINFHNYDVSDHNLWLQGTAPSVATQQISAEIGEGGDVTRTVQVAPGAWRLYCSLPGHETMSRTLDVG